MPRTYRIVSNYGDGDKTWQARGVPEADVLAALERHTGRRCDSLEAAEDGEVHYIEEDHPADTEDWDFADS